LTLAIVWYEDYWNIKYSISSIQVIFVKRIGAQILWLSYDELVAGGNETEGSIDYSPTMELLQI